VQKSDFDILWLVGLAGALIALFAFLELSGGKENEVQFFSFADGDYKAFIFNYDGTKG